MDPPPTPLALGLIFYCLMCLYQMHIYKAGCPPRQLLTHEALGLSHLSSPPLKRMHRTAHFFVSDKCCRSASLAALLITSHCNGHEADERMHMTITHLSCLQMSWRDSADTFRCKRLGRTVLTAARQLHQQQAVTTAKPKILLNCKLSTEREFTDELNLRMDSRWHAAPHSVRVLMPSAMACCTSLGASSHAIRHGMLHLTRCEFSCHPPWLLACVLIHACSHRCARAKPCRRANPWASINLRARRRFAIATI
eukprot:364354-Chlamydomonas_euryale.AAC.15